MNALLPRVARNTDLPAIKRLLAECDLPVDDIDLSLQTFFLLEDNTIIACAAIEFYGDAGLLRSVAVAPAKRGEGLGKIVTKKVLEHAKAKGLKTIYLLTTTAESYFTLFGFNEIHRDKAPDAIRGSREFREICPSSAVFMELAI